MNKYVLSSLAIFGLSACATHYAQAPEDASHAVLNFVNEPKLMVGERIGVLVPNIEQKYVSVSDQTCSKPTELAHFSQSDKDHKPIRVKSDQTINVLAYNVYGGSKNILNSQPGRPSENCNSMASFTPRKDGNYIVRMQETENKICEIFVIDYSTKMAPADLTIKNRVECG